MHDINNPLCIIDWKVAQITRASLLDENSSEILNTEVGNIKGNPIEHQKDSSS